MNNQDAKGLIKMPVAKYSRTGLPSGCRIIIILSKLTNLSKNKNQEKHKGLNEKTDLLTKTTKLKIQTHF